ncbi:pilus assembly protein [Tessaracoccus rhinocerotis]|uniref:Pilus assembly protein n=1 Tax=Tessaracoccus rhinocerotis TaxID=1689449 RepID=A0A553JXS3_9ACTN|nr:TadE/TadG family type IV pilus assembly protein [Tessaracoccus rhinocerotis]TRY17251.1 pilus assembly protein [Tessaracoccus rhinocerotis]
MSNERGLSGGVQVALLFPVAFSVLLLALQWAFVSWADATALAAAQDGARVAAGFEGNADAGDRVASEAADNGSLTAMTVYVQRGAVLTTVTVSGRSVSVVPGWAPLVTKSAEFPTERLTR